MAKKTKPIACPFCGQLPRVDTGVGGFAFEVRCVNPECHVKPVIGRWASSPASAPKDITEATRRWNHRA